MVEYILTMTASVGGSTVPTLGPHTYTAGSTIMGIMAYPDVGYVFDRWVLDGVDVGAAVPFSVVMDTDHTLHAVFTGVAPPLEYALTIETAVGGTTVPTPGSYIHSAGTVVTVTAYPDAGMYFQQWILNGVVHRKTPLPIIMNATYVLTASFAETPPPLPPPEEVNVAMMGGVAVAVVDAALIIAYLLKHFKVID